MGRKVARCREVQKIVPKGIPSTAGGLGLDGFTSNYKSLVFTSVYMPLADMISLIVFCCTFKAVN